MLNCHCDLILNEKYRLWFIFVYALFLSKEMYTYVIDQFSIKGVIQKILVVSMDRMESKTMCV